ncbi:MAG TPA: glycosyltransferase family 1 protein [Candidatus Deferrimicrobium sp.]|nr:glycosyltransferase family 1 protein [Candidatus Deferrimicrobium sp.]
MSDCDRLTKPLRIVFSPDMFSLEKYGGASRYLTELIPRVASMDGFEVSVHMGFSPNRYGLQQMRHQAVSFRYVHFPFNRGLRYLALLNEFWFQRYMNMRSKQVDAVHMTYYPRRMPTVRVPLTATVYDMIPERFPDLFGQSPLLTQKRACVERCSRIITISESAKRDIVEFYHLDPLRVDVTPLANSLHTEPSDDPIGRPYVLFVGGRERQKNFDRFVRVWAEMRSLRDSFLIVCFGWNRFSESEWGLISALGLSHSIAWMEGSDVLLASLYAHAQALIYPSFYEGFGLPPLEAMHYGCPVMCSNSSSLPEVVGDAAMTVDTTDSEALASGMAAVIGDSVLRSQLVLAGRVREATFTWDRTAVGTVESYRRLLS